MAAQSTNPARGMRDFLPADVRKREYVIGVIKEVYESYGFEPLETPAVENLETLTGKYGEEGNQLIYKILKRGEKLDPNDKELADLALRYDLTVPLARVVANYKNDLPKFFKRYQIQPVWRADRPARGRFREFYQCDVDTIGSRLMIVEAEQISAVCEILRKLDFDYFITRLNHREVLFGILEGFGVTKEKINGAIIALDKLDKIGPQGVINEFRLIGITQESIQKFTDFYDRTREALDQTLYNQSKEVYGFNTIKDRERYTNAILDSLEKLIGNNDAALQGLVELRSIMHLAKSISISGYIAIDPFLARGLSYYTGAIMEVYVGKEMGSFGGGGRYDGLIGMFGKEEIPACGFSLGLERILVVMEERGMFQKPIDEGKLKLDSADVMVACFDEAIIGGCLKLASELRQKNLRVLMYPEANQKGKPIKYAEQINVPFVCLVKENELAENKVTLKNMQTGEQETISREEIAEKILAMTGAQASRLQ